ncbi:phosphopantetheine-binding [Catenulispora acidiphila DSM 44928]|uniref:Phosphopantetheine-binding n=1 Tax=Catenulispora acidiphila (strain DSM 44928 / JCM 14897 / NBRC 102108 / NRRL B-24433 / ID139908) TaxID=479433 RepID=C7Q4Y2_CATAD|nr:condensation domain-containing protein [Catenulispora acidiphila]ACU73930.1 phosphopantetheine-binding [Catenulispora acidiphila DSM 44928]
MADMTQATFAQHGIRMAQLASGGTAYHMPLVIHLDGDADAGTVAKACAALVERHPLLATALVERDGITYLAPAENAPLLRVADAGERVEDEIAQPFDLDHGPLIRFVLFGRDLVVTAHHTVFDGFSKDVLVRDFLALRGETEPRPLPISFAEHADAERTRVEAALGGARELWKTRWQGPAPVVVRNSVLNSRRAEDGEVIDIELPRIDVPGLTVFEATAAALHVLLFSYGNSRPVTAIDLSTRTPETADLIGPFVNELPLASEPVDDLSFRDFALGVRAELRDIYPFREVPLARAVPRIAPHAALAPISLSFRERSGEIDAGVEWLVFNGAVRGDLQLQIVDTGRILQGSLRFSARAAEHAQPFVDELDALLRSVVQDPDSRLADLLTVKPAVAEAEPVAEPAGASPSEVAGVDGELVEQIREIWQEVLGVARVEVDDDLFDLDGHSLTVTQIAARMRARLGIDISIDALFDNPTIAGALDAVNAR